MAETFNGRSVPDDVLRSLRADRIIEAIKGWREYTGDSLVDSKNFIEAIRNQVKPKFQTTPIGEVPREELLRKMLNMTTSDNDGQALVAIRKANALLESAGWSWDKLLAAKIKIVENPFKNMPNPIKPERVDAPPTTPYPPDSKQFAGASSGRWSATPPQPPRPTPPPRPASRGLGLTRSNMYANHCYCCGDYVANNTGFIMKPRDFNINAPDKWAMVCKDCNINVGPHNIPRTAAMKQTGQTTVRAPAPNLGDL